MTKFEFDLIKTCRSCLREGDNMCTIQSPMDCTPMANHSVKLENIAIADVMMSCTRIKVMPDDGLPQIICTDCVEQLQQSFVYKRMCEASDAKLRECLLRKNAIKIEVQESDIIAPECINVSDFNANDPLDEYFSELKTDVAMSDVKRNRVYDEDDFDQHGDSVNDADGEMAEEIDSEKYDGGGDGDGDGDGDVDEDIRLARTAKRIGKRFQCQLCGKSLASRRSFLLHVRLHIGKKLKKCSICHRGFSKKNHLDRHMLTHSKSYSCDHCTNVFESKKLKKNHIISVHGVALSKTTTKSLEIKSEQIETRAKRSASKPKGFFSHLQDGDSDKNGESDKDDDSGNEDETFVPDNVTDDGDDDVVSDNIEPPKKQIRNETVDKTDKENDNDGGDINSDDEESRLLKGATEVNGRFQCPLCLKTLSDRTVLKLHLRLHTGKNLKQCSICGKEYVKTSHLNRHMLCHVAENDAEEARLIENAKMVNNRFNCPFCVKTLADRQAFRLHIRLHIGHKLNRCTVCDRRFARQELLNKHMAVHMDEFPCHKCTEVFKTSQERTNHFSEIHRTSAIAQIKMEDQGAMSDKRKVETEKEMSIRSTENPNDDDDDDEDERLVNSAKCVNGRYECKFCTKTLVSRNTLKLHIRLHIGKKLKRCSVCDQGFAKQSHLNRHMSSHLKKTYPCGHCEQVFDTYQERKVHESAMHKDHPLPKDVKSMLPVSESFSAWSQPNGEKKCICMICDASFNRIASMRTHLQWHADTKESFNGIDLIAKREIFKDFREFDNVSNEDMKDNQFSSFLQQQIKENSPMTSKMYCITNEIGWELSLSDSETDYNDCDEERVQVGLHECGKCNESFDRLHKLVAHIKRDHDVNTFATDFADFACPHCMQYYPNAFTLAKHMRQQCENADKKFYCLVCGARFMWQSSLDQHRESLHATILDVKKLLGTGNQLRPKPFACESCPKRFFRQDHLDRHRSNHLPREKRFSCDLCKKRFSRTDNLKSHMRVHIPSAERECVDKHLCAYCGRSFSNSSNLVVHMRRHTGEKPYKCDICDRGFPRSSDLQCHRRTHTGEKPCLCTICGRGFSRSNKLVRHMRIHTGDRPYKCTHCERAFTQSNDLTLHIRRHTGSKPYACGICNERFITNSLLSQHRRSQGHFEKTSNEPTLPSNSVNHPNRLLNVSTNIANGGHLHLALPSTETTKVTRKKMPMKPLLSLSISPSGVITTQPAIETVTTGRRQNMATSRLVATQLTTASGIAMTIQHPSLTEPMEDIISESTAQDGTTFSGLSYSHTSYD